MQRIRELWSRLDTINRIILFSGVAVAIGFLAMKQGKSAVAVVVLMGVFMLNHASQRRKACHRMYGNLYFHMPDGEIVPRMFELVKSEYQHGGVNRYHGREVTVRFRYWRRDAEDALDTGYGLMIETVGCEAAKELLASLKVGQFVSVTGHITAKSSQYFTIGELSDIRRIREDEVMALMPREELPR